CPLRCTAHRTKEIVGTRITTSASGESWYYDRQGLDWGRNADPSDINDQMSNQRLRPSASSRHMRRCITCSYSITSSARKKRRIQGVVKLGSVWMIAPMMYVTQTDFDDDVIISCRL